MKITITSETTGNEVVEYVCGMLAASNLKITAETKDIQTQVQNKEGKWVDFDPAKIRFVYSK